MCPRGIDERVESLGGSRRRRVAAASATPLAAARLLLFAPSRRLRTWNDADQVWVFLVLPPGEIPLLGFSLGLLGLLLLQPGAVVQLPAALHLGLFGRSGNRKPRLLEGAL